MYVGGYITLEHRSKVWAIDMDLRIIGSHGSKGVY